MREVAYYCTVPSDVIGPAVSEYVTPRFTVQDTSTVQYTQQYLQCLSTWKERSMRKDRCGKIDAGKIDAERSPNP